MSNRGVPVMTRPAAEEIPLNLRLARRQDAAGIANVFVNSWRETYAGILPTTALSTLSVTREARQWAATIANQTMRTPTIVAVDAKDTVFGFANAGPSRDRTLPYEAEVYTLYVAPGHTGQGIGRALLLWSFRLFTRSGFRTAIIWALEQNPSRFFYEAQGGALVAERSINIFGGSQREVGYAWRNLAQVAGSLT
ncbi:MAG TPA: GNAT family N-acetyltransferase [Alphaproteobacteria bacterium]|nr:GNAT family N-acetyltransferase [Alphaproteobacteria bacterium]